MSWRCAIAVDVGGTFTDIAVARTDGTRFTSKVPSVPSDPSAGVLAAVAAVATDLTVDVSELLARCDRFVHGSTVATNAVLTGDLARVGLITTVGFRDTLEIRRGIRADQWDHRAPWPPVLVPRHRRVGIAGRIDAGGNEQQPLDLDAVHRAVEHFVAEEVDAVAICLLHSYLDPIHETRAATIVREIWPDALTTVSSELTPHLGEYARTSTAVVNAGLVPRVGAYLRRLDDSLRGRGLSAGLLLLQSNGGTVPLASVERRPVDLVLSGPAAVGGALKRISRPGHELVSMEIGGTSCDVAVSDGGVVPVVDGLVVGGYHVDVPAVDVHTVGAGGGTIAAVELGFLRVGPEGAGAEPGPAGYARGGELPTATDAHLVLGRLRAGPYAGGAVELDIELANGAVSECIARPLGIADEDAAIGIITILEQHLRHAVETNTIQRGRDPGAMTLIAAGGAGGLHGSSVARALGCRRLVVPADAGVFCALGMLDSDLRRDVSRSIVTSIDALTDAAIAAALREQSVRGRSLIEHEWPDDVDVVVTGHVDVRYPGQLWSVRVEASGESATVDGIRSAFEAEYERLYGHVQRDGALELTAVGAVLHGRLPMLPPVVRAASPAPTPGEHRRCWLDHETGWDDVPVYDEPDLGAGCELNGPFVIEAATTTVLGHHGDHLVVLPSGDLEVTFS